MVRRKYKKDRPLFKMGEIVVREKGPFIKLASVENDPSKFDFQLPRNRDFHLKSKVVEPDLWVVVGFEGKDTGNVHIAPKEGGEQVTIHWDYIYHLWEVGISV